MSYNTRRTGTGAGGGVGRGTTTQVNYHQQQPPRTMSNPTQPRTTAGYTTTPQQPPTTYNSAAQPAFSTQPAYSSAPPLPKASPQQPPAQQAKPPAVASSTPIAAIKAEPITPQGTPKAIAKTETPENGEGSTRPAHWKRKQGIKIPPKVKKLRMNAKLRRVLVPKSALNFLQELRPGACKFEVTEDDGWGYVATCEVEGKTFTGHGLSMGKAKTQASEQALKHLMLEQLAKVADVRAASTAAVTSTVKTEEGTNTSKDEAMETDEGEGGEQRPKRKIEEDPVPWGSLASFALHKLFDEWQKDSTQSRPAPMMAQNDDADEYYGQRPYAHDDYFGPPAGPRSGSFGARGGPRPPFPRGGRGRGFNPFSGAPRGGGYPQAYGMPRRPPVPTANFCNSAFFGAPKAMNPMKEIPKDANQRHPVALLNQLKPSLEYVESREGFPPNFTFVMTIDVDGKAYVGQGKNKKEAKKQAAKAALVPMGVIYDE